MVDWLRPILVAAAVMVGLWAMLVVLAARLPPGLLRDLAGYLPTCVTLARRLGADPRVPWPAKAAVVVAGLWVCPRSTCCPSSCPPSAPWTTWWWSPWPCATPPAGVPPEVLLEAWPGKPRLLERLLGQPATTPHLEPEARGDEPGTS